MGQSLRLGTLLGAESFGALHYTSSKHYIVVVRYSASGGLNVPFFPTVVVILVQCNRSSLVNKGAIDADTLLWFEQESDSLSFQKASE